MAGNGVTEEREARVAVEVPIGGGSGRPFSASILDLAAHGYGEREFFYGGDATAYELLGDVSPDGKWTLRPCDRAPFKSRLLVRRPLDPARFNGTVVLEWLNVSGGADGDPGFMYNSQEILREGYAWVGVSAQKTGVEGGLGLMSGAQGLKQHDPERYGSLAHPGDGYSFDIYTSAARVVRGAGPIDVLDGLEPKRLIAYGESQSAIRLVSYVNGVHPRVEIYDGFFIHSRAGGGAPFDNEPGVRLGRTATRIRDDLTVPVFQFQTETDVLGPFGYRSARQPDSDRLRSWEVAGTAHADAYILDFNAADFIPRGGINDGPQHFVIKAALHALHRWLAEGVAPAHSSPLASDERGEPITDAHGNTLGGVRTPHVDVPIALHSGRPAPGSSGILAALFGHTRPFDAEQLAALYPTHDAYVSQVRDSARRAREAGFLLEPEEGAMVRAAQEAPIPK